MNLKKVLLIAAVTWCGALSTVYAEVSPACAKLAEQVSRLRTYNRDSKNQREAYEAYLRVDPRPPMGNEIDATGTANDNTEMFYDELIKGARADGKRRALIECEIREAKKRESWTVKPEPGEEKSVHKSAKVGSKQRPPTWERTGNTGWKSF